VDIGCFAGRQLEGFIDVAHFGFLHAATFGNPDNVEVPPYVPKQTPKGFQADYRSSVGNYPIGVDGRAPPGFEWLRHFEVHLPSQQHADDPFSRRGAAGDHERGVPGLGAPNADVRSHRA